MQKAIRKIGFALKVMAIAALPASAWASVQLEIIYLRIEQPSPPTLSNIDPPPHDLGQIGARLGVEDVNITGAFMDYQINLHEKIFKAGELSAAQEFINLATAEFVLLDMSAEDMLEIVSDRSKLFFNISAFDNELRNEDCRENLFHTFASYQMRGDALAQFLVFKNWNEIALVTGNQTQDAKFAVALKRAFKNYNIKIKGENNWPIDGDIRRAASAEVSLFTQQFGEYDALIIADERNDFARYIAYNSWQARPIMGADGLMPKAWSRVFERWGAAQLQSRFKDLANRDMQSQDFAAWAAIRAIDEAYQRTMKTNKAEIHSYLLSEDFELAGFKGQPLSFRSWNGQLRQPIGLVTHSAMVANAPLEGFLHTYHPLDTLGFDQAQSTCKEFSSNE